MRKIKSEHRASCIAVPEKRPLPEIKIAKPTLEQISKRMEESGDVLRLMSESAEHSRQNNRI